VKELRRHPSVEFCFMDDRKRHARVAGDAKIIDDIEAKRTLWNMSSRLREYYSGPDDPRFVIIEIAPKTIMWMAGDESEYNRVEL